MAKICACDEGLNNTGISNCPTLMDVTKGLIAVSRVANDGTSNSIPSGTTLDAAFFESKLNEPDPSKRFFPVMNLDNVENLRADSNFQTTGSGRNIFLTEGVRAFQGDIIGADPKVKGFLDSWSCGKIMVYAVDKSRNMWGIQSADGLSLEGMPIDGNTNDPKFLFTTDTTKNAAQVKFEFDELMRDEDISYFASSDITGVDILTINGLLNVNVAVSLETSTTFTITMTQDYGPISLKNPIEGYLITDFTLVETSPTPGAIVITTVTESAPGVYDFVVPINAGATNLLTAAKNGFDFPPTEIEQP